MTKQMIATAIVKAIADAHESITFDHALSLVSENEDGSYAVNVDGGEYAYYLADYYGEYRGGYSWMSPELESFASENGAWLEWENPGELSIYFPNVRM
jgi:hypothetical protein